MKKSFFIFLVTIMFITGVATAGSLLTVVVDGDKVKFPDQKPYINQDNRTMVPVRFVSEELGYKVKWESAKKQVTITNGSSSVILTLGSRYMKINGKTEKMDTAATLVSGRTFVPIRFVSQSLDSSIKYDSKTKTISIKQPEPEPTPPPKPTPTPTPTPAPENGTTYTVEKGDTVYSISKRFGIQQADLVSWNGIVNNHIVPGQVLIVGEEALPEKPETDLALSGKVIVVDPGHGGMDSGAIGSDGATKEKTINLAVSKMLQTNLKNLGATVVMTRSADTSCDPGAGDLQDELQCRVDVATEYGADIFVSVHSNWYSSPLQDGSELFYNQFPCDLSEEYCKEGSVNGDPVGSQKLATSIWNELKTVVGSSPRGLDGSTHYYVNRKNSMPSVLVELGYMSNAVELNKLKNPSVQQQFADEIRDGIVNYFK
ncbi:N-acetylmuramoyl-L-alanine amidase (plasmid) [Pontibacillus sp. ALD_SL1]|uniref:N-acetylmuramoyl-L-alanine amidase n=1 Tax=Pontibacillus sp. ALD_SL1 TaxID=2777185 RepID=UPI001A961B18|nr:N-acetylmuramoyl-L-alanine amidase [Pontibacillus sp. ALD_SL1]QST02948.1 N-acetylmuramoyl-L-alanine amidase [Pontibacillus sp. ALD_SL1]